MQQGRACQVGSCQVGRERDDQDRLQGTREVVALPHDDRPLAGLLTLPVGAQVGPPDLPALGYHPDALTVRACAPRTPASTPDVMTRLSAILDSYLGARGSVQMMTMAAIPLDLKKAIAIGIGLFIAFIGFFTSGFVVKPAAGPLPVALARGLEDAAQKVFAHVQHLESLLAEDPHNETLEVWRDDWKETYDKIIAKKGQTENQRTSGAEAQVAK